ncbi:hypothetical protein GCM10011342_23660 [Aquisalinus flavus]|uniref:Uncharacterized protein n=1 Tax=Aquisalinus flavus TaxID=1526572 RepID=A0A8J2Y442_9PROT|nr:hypothetical protein GCM10011342_23660 [Aquisalinus flavus]
MLRLWDSPEAQATKKVGPQLPAAPSVARSGGGREKVNEDGISVSEGDTIIEYNLSVRCSTGRLHVTHMGDILDFLFVFRLVRKSCGSKKSFCKILQLPHSQKVGAAGGCAAAPGISRARKGGERDI